MKKLTFLMALLFCFTIKASADDYPLNFTNATKDGRLYSGISLNSKFYGVQTVNATIDNSSATAKQYMYEDLTSQKFYCVAGEQLTASFNHYNGATNYWLNGYIYIDDDKNGQFEYGVDENHKPTGDLYAYSFYTTSTSSDESGYNSAGTAINKSTNSDPRNNDNPPSFVAPSVPGVYRMRYKADWCSIEPGGDTNSGFGGTFSSYKGSIFDVTLVVVGYCNVSSAATDRNGKLHSDYNYINSKHSFLAANTESTNNFIWKIEPADATGLKFNLTSGQGFPLMLKDGTTPSLSFNTRTSAGAIYFTEAVNATKDQYATGDTKSQKAALTTWTGYPNALDNQWVFTKIDEIENEAGYVYSVNITKSVESLDISNARITKTATSELAFNGGFFYCTATPTESDFTAFEIENTTATIAVDEVAKTITVTYSEAAVYITDTEIAEAQALLALAGKVGYPSLTSDAYSTFNTFVGNLTTSVTMATYTAAVNAFKTATDIALPEDGKAYKIKCQAHEWSAYVKYGEVTVGTGGSKTTLVGSTTADTYETTFICHEISAGNYLFVDNAGRYLKWVCDQDSKVYDATGETAKTYNATYNVLSLARASVDANNGRISSNVKDTDFFGRIEIKGTRTDGTTKSFLNMRHKTSDRENYPFISEAGLERYYDTDDERRSHTFIFEETDYPNLVNMTTATGIDEGTKKIATFSAPFAFTLPANVDAYVVAQAPQSNTAKMTAIEYAGGAVAANTGVILYGATSETKVRMIPAASNGTSVSGNMLGNSAGGTKQIVDVAGETNYILASKGGNIVFSKALANGENKSISMNKAYLSIPTGSGVNQFALSFGEDGPTTGIGSIEASQAGSAAAPLYDLSGRRISQPVTRGIYIRGGKKFMVK